MILSFIVFELYLSFEKNENKQKEAGFGPFFKKEDCCEAINIKVFTKEIIFCTTMYPSSKIKTWLANFIDFSQMEAAKVLPSHSTLSLGGGDLVYEKEKLMERLR